ncbi:uncharacterized protein L969DRAFT_87250 [Mixia osmundae IAM 14324]|uniref:25S rRNA (uridine-N(3))-methyltransferase BMT5-like domain-containing protein n=1 Tax=Mixia osmundae (strain CBS 9802 / IAM 14324 / JCM 22182 / KY 12970) TaxID=764103 RepID=G7E3A6_MIXOS|nr:uncharacterized protein L969DRAFT_87250 [Mixia osmundae IAM 14324]KEI39303.1 hypothetical protein L969DRAFT_87250 [Mixia osmundae IAM 14324]GAA97316.1 hypothetical protein E5Q_03994 [Mixia osmundae IAM 14324]
MAKVRRSSKLSKALAGQQVAQARREAEIARREREEARAEALRSGKSTQKLVFAKGKAKQVSQSVLPFNKNDSILLVGEANFSFALSLFEHHLPESARRLVATSFDSLETARTKYDDLDANVAKLTERGMTVLFDVDATRLDKCKALKGKRFDRIVFNFPHTGSGEKDQARNVRTNQVLLLGFLRSAADFLTEGDASLILPKDGKPQGKKRARTDDEDELAEQASLASRQRLAMADKELKHAIGTRELDQDELDDLLEAEQDAPEHEQEEHKKPGTILITLRNTLPYTLWDVPMLARRGHKLVPTVMPMPLNRTAHLQPAYATVRSFAFQPSLYPGYAHRRTIGFQKGISTLNSEDVFLPSKYRKQDDRADDARDRSKQNDVRTWEFALVASQQ